MPRPKQSVSEIAHMRERILDAADELLLQQGAGALSVRAIAERVGVSHMSLYTYFHCRGEIIDALLERTRERMNVHHEALYEQARAGDATGAMCKLIDHVVQMARRHPHVFAFVWLAQIGPESHTHPGCRRRAAFTVALEHAELLVTIGMQNGEFAPGDARTSAATAVSMAIAPSLLHASGRLEDTDLRDHMEEEALKASLCYLQGMAVAALVTTLESEGH